MEHVLNSDSTRLRQILPSELWRLVAKTLLKRGSENVDSLAICSQFFRNLFTSQVTTYSFEKVFTSVTSTVWKNKGLEGLPVSEVLKLRGVCSHWNAIIDKLIFEKFQVSKQFSNDICHAFSGLVTNPSLSNQPSVNEDISIESIDSFLRHFESSHPGNEENGRNPWIWGNLKLIVEAVAEGEVGFENYHRYLERISTVLSKYGMHLDQFSLHLYRYDLADGVTQAQILRDWFSCIPNLKKLEISGDNGWRENGMFSAYELPKLEVLENLDIDHLPSPLFNQLVRQSSNLSTLVVQSGDYDLDCFSFPLTNLRKLTIDNVTDESMFLLVEKCISPEVQWPLESLALDLSQDVGFDYAPLFQVIQDKFANTLVSLEFTMRHVDQENEQNLWQAFSDFRLNLPNLRKIKLQMRTEPICLDFLLPMKHNLEEILAEVSYKRPHWQIGNLTSGSIVQFMGFEGKMLESNIWAIFKKLKFFTVGATWEENKRDFRSFSREEWLLNNEYV